jgi:hypothetical protein
MENESVNDLFVKMNDLQDEISMWSSSNSQSNPGAVMHLRWMKKEVEKIEKELFVNRLKQKESK